MNTPLVSIIIPVKNGARTIEKTLRSVFQLDGPEFEIIVIDDGSTDDTRRILGTLRGDIPGSDRLCIIFNAVSQGASRARNRGIREARGEYIAFTDADCIVEKNWLVELLRCFTDASIAGAGGIQRSPMDDTAFGKDLHDFMAKIGFVADYMKDPLTAGDSITETVHNPSCNAIYRAGVLDQVGGFWEDLWPGEDVDLDFRIRKAGFRLLFNPGAVVYHYRPSNFRAFWRMMFNYGRVQAFLVRRHGRFRKIQSFPAYFVTAAAVTAFASFLRPSALLLIPAAAAASLWLLFVSRRASPSAAFRFTGLGLAALCAWNLGFFKGRLSKLPGSVSK